MTVTLFFYYLPPYFKALENYLLSIWNSYFPETSSIFSNLFSSITISIYYLQGILTAIGFIPSGLMFNLTIPDLFVLRNTISPRPFQVVILLSV